MTLLLLLTFVTGLLAVGVGVVDGNILGARHPRWFIALCLDLVLLGWGLHRVLRRQQFL